MNLQQDDVTFWSERFKDHAMLLYILIDGNKANDLKLRAYQEFVNWDSYLQNPDVNTLNLLITSLSELKHDVLEFSKITQINLVISHNDFISLVDHMIEELMFFLRVISGISPDDELSFWVKENIEHTELLNHLISSISMTQENYDQLKVDSYDVIQRLKSIRDPHSLLPIYQWSNQIALKLDKLIQEGDKTAVQDLFHMMVEHEIKEGVRGAIRIRQLTNM